ncbi:helix-turn-helix domain-containing protein [Alkalicoccobacillus plakortidis]|uniref:AraC family transcriptional regulator n=1 Tax=Alkalicoccobacillus plakortidis TaxID=444060 RepID=A0ABT0XL58_9BACI|nr:helix-turn-helix domain-containing protein [Alkalicoccobacillus plakortidis]MCM2676643.1 AraC family transcriptional regulator [Alkalicoccobacillus plakortidis]
MVAYSDVQHEHVLKENALKQPIQCHMEHSSPSNQIANPHFHEAIELLFSFSGKAKMFVGGETFVMEEGDLVIINSNEVHSIFAEEGEDTRYLVIKLEPEVLYSTSRSIFESKYVLPFTMAKTSPQTLLTKKETSHTAISTIIDQIMKEFYLKEYGYDFAIRIQICSIFLEVLRYWRNHGVAIRETEPYNEVELNLMREVFDLIEKQFSTAITARDAAKHCKLSYSYFSRKIKMITGRSFTELLNYVRVTEAEKLLSTTNLTVTEIAVTVGYSSTSYFIQQFRGFKQTSPYQFRKKLAANDLK